MKQFLIAPDSFKGSLSAIDFCQIAGQSIQASYPDSKVFSLPLSDGGEGFVDAVVFAGVAERKTLKALDPLSREVSASYAWQAETKTAIVEMAQASGLPLLTADERDPTRASSFGTGQVIQAAIDNGAKKIVLGLGGSATNDGGSGALQALGFRFFAGRKEIKRLLPKQLKQITQIQAPDNYADLMALEWHLACDVTNPFLGETGATAIFGPQKGVTAANHDFLETSLSHWADVIQQYSGIKVHDMPSAGAAGGMAGGFIGLMNAKVFSGFDLLAEFVGLQSIFEDSELNLVLTGEGRMDAQTQFGKLPYRVAQMAQSFEVPTIAICGSFEPAELEAFADIQPLSEEVIESEAHLQKIFQETPDRLRKKVAQVVQAF